MEKNITNLLGLKDVIVKNIENKEAEIHINIELPRHKHKCPVCGVETDKIHDYRHQRIKDCRAFGKDVYLHLQKRRYVCTECGKRFYEENSFLPRYYRITQRELVSIINDFREVVSAKHISKEHNVSVSTALRYFDLVNYGSCPLPEVLSIDEFRGNAGGEKFQTIITDGREHQVLNVLPNRKSADLIQYFHKYSRKDRLKVKCVIMDMSSLFNGVVKACFPNAIIIADRYHVVRQVIWAMENVRKRVQKSLSAEWRKYFKRSRYLLDKNPDKLTDEEKDKLRVILGISQELEYAYNLKNDFLELMKSPNSSVGKEKLSNWLYFAENSALPEFRACTTAFHNWSNEITNSFDYSYSNGFTEGCNNKTKVLKRVCFGCRNFARFRNRILHCSART